jgi:hypothetical protein
MTPLDAFPFLMNKAVGVTLQQEAKLFVSAVWKQRKTKKDFFLKKGGL